MMPRVTAKSVLLGSAAVMVLSAATASAADERQTIEELRRLIELQQRQIEAQSHRLEEMGRRLEEVESGGPGSADGLRLPPALTRTGADGGEIPLPPPRPRDRELEQPREKVERPERAQAEEPTGVAPAQAVTAGDRPGTFRLPGTDTSVRIGGYVKGDFIYNINADVGDTFDVGAIPPDGSAEDQRDPSTRLHARQSRINIATFTPSPLGEVETFVEGDFFGVGGNEIFSNSTSFRIRHAFGQLGPFLAGQTWTLFMPLESYPATVDFFGPVGIPFIRQGQLRWTQPIGENWTVAASVENSETAGRATTGETFARSVGDLRFGIDRAPDFIGAVEYQNGDFYWKLSGLARVLGVDDGNDIDETEFGWGVFTGGVIPVLGETFLGESTKLMLNFTFGDGVGRYIINGAFQDAILDAGGNLDSIRSWGFAGAIQHQWAENWSSNIVYGRYDVSDRTLFGTDTETLDSIHVNLFWTPVPRVVFGLEYMHGRRNFRGSDFDNTANRVQFAGQFFF